MALDPHSATQLAEEALAIMRNGTYAAPEGSVAIGDDIARAVANTIEHSPSDALATPVARHTTRISVTSESTLAAARRLAGRHVAALNFASGKHPGGGFLAGALAQEESLCRSSALFACLERQAMYGYHAMRNDPFYSDRVIFSPAVPIFRDDSGALTTPINVAFLTSPAVNARLVLERDATAGPAIEAAMRARAARVLEVAAAHDIDTLVLGAWGAGVFGNAPELVADAFGSALEGTFEGVFAEVVFAVLGEATRVAFEQRFAA